MKLIVTIDTEEDSWGNYFGKNFTVKNISNLPVLHDLFLQYNVAPTYLISYQVASQERSAEVLSEIAPHGRVELAAHCHPWNTPPIREQRGRESSMLCNLPFDLQLAKIEALTAAITRNLAVRPISFRAGRWGFSDATAAALARLGYLVDSSITPFVSWAKYGGPDHSQRSSDPFWLKADGEERPLLEMPATVGFLQGINQATVRMHQLCDRRLRKLHAAGVLERIGMLNRIWLSPEVSSLDQMIRLSRAWAGAGIESGFLNLTFHSPTLTPGLTPFVRTAADRDTFIKKIASYLSFAAGEGFVSILLKDALQLVEVEESTWREPRRSLQPQEQQARAAGM